MGVFGLMAFGLTVGCLALSIGFYRVLPWEIKIFRLRIPMRKLIRKHKLIGVVLNFALSKIITSFIGAGMASGFANLVGSLLFGIYLWADPWIEKWWPYKG
jgi:hypothetical protein